MHLGGPGLYNHSKHGFGEKAQNRLNMTSRQLTLEARPKARKAKTPLGGSS